MMKILNFNDQELEHMIASYEVELAYAEDEITRIKQILKKIDSARKGKVEKIITTSAKK